MPQLDPRFFISQIFWLFICLFVIFVFLKFSFIPRIGGIVNTRSIKMAADKKFANDAVAEYSALKSQAESIISDAKAAALSALEKKVQEIEKKYALDVAAIDKDISRKLADEDEKMSRLRISLHKDAAAVSLTLRKSIEEKFGIYNHD